LGKKKKKGGKREGEKGYVPLWVRKVLIKQHLGGVKGGDPLLAIDWNCFRKRKRTLNPNLPKKRKEGGGGKGVIFVLLFLEGNSLQSLLSKGGGKRGGGIFQT